MMASRYLLACALAACPVIANVAHAGGVTTGVASVTIATQTTTRAIFNWTQFAISGGAVSFVQPNASTVALNRVAGATAATIDGSLANTNHASTVGPASSGTPHAAAAPLLHAPGAQEIGAGTAKGVLDGLINTSGIVVATQASVVNGKVVLTGQP